CIVFNAIRWRHFIRLSLISLKIIHPCNGLKNFSAIFGYCEKCKLANKKMGLLCLCKIESFYFLIRSLAKLFAVSSHCNQKAQQKHYKLTMENLLKYIRKLTDFSENSWELLQPVLTKKEFRKKEFLVQQGQVCNSLFYIDKGYCKSYYEIDGVVKNTGFFFENEIATNISSFGSGLKSDFNIIACEPLTAIIFDKDKLFQATKQAHEIETLGRNCVRLFAT